MVGEAHLVRFRALVDGQEKVLVDGVAQIAYREHTRDGVLFVLPQRRMVAGNIWGEEEEQRE